MSNTLVIEPGPGVLGVLALMECPNPPFRNSVPRSPADFAQGRIAILNLAVGKVTPALRERARSLSICGPAGDVAVTLMLPAGEIRGAMLHIHGGGWWCGSADMTLDLHARWADDHGIAVASVDYRLAPENPYPAAVDDCEAAALWWVDYCRREFQTDRVLIGGESAGAHLAMVTTLRMRQRRGYRFAGGKYSYGMYDFTNGLPSRIVADGRNLVQDSESCRFYAGCFVPRTELWADPDVSPLFAKLDGDLPPAFFSVGELDPFLDDSLLMHARWQLAGNRSRLVVVKQAVHGFDMLFPTPEAEQLRAEEKAFMNACLVAPLEACHEPGEH